jgi:IclR family acetate operon transcriptional repressor
MTRIGTSAPQTLTRSLLLLERIIDDDRGLSLSMLAGELGISSSSAHRLAVGFEKSGFLLRVGRGHYVAGPLLLRLAGARRDWGSFAARVSRPILGRLAKQTGKTVHLGVFEENMVTYLLKIGDRKGEAISRQGMQLEAYCSGIGKVLLSHLPPGERDAYLATEPFVGLTATTITSAAALRTELDAVRAQGYAVDDEEMVPGLICIAAPVARAGDVVAAVSMIVSQDGPPCTPTELLPPLRRAIGEIEARLFPYNDEIAEAGDSQVGSRDHS